MLKTLPIPHPSLRHCPKESAKVDTISKFIKMMKLEQLDLLVKVS
jgi:hypothetical protein